MRSLRRWAAVLAVLAGALALPDAALACNGWTEPNMETQLICVVCHERLDQSTSQFSTRVRHYLIRWCREDWTADRVRNTLVAQFGEEILAAPPKSGFGLVAWTVPIAVLGGGAAVAGGLAVVWSRRRRAGPAAQAGGPVDPELDARIDSDLAGFE
ncbi:MAG: cytochrome c-type biogenesis protein CcmH [Gaiellales bacterium]